MAAMWRRRLARRAPVVGRLLRELEAARGELERLRELHGLPTKVHVVVPREERTIEVLRRPSFLSRTSDLQRVRRLSRALHNHADPIWSYNGKPEGRALAARLGLRVPELLIPPAPLRDVDEPPRQPCVLKPIEGASSRGVTPLIPADDGRWQDLFALEAPPEAWHAILERLDATVAEGRVAADFFIEELVPGRSRTTLPYDWKVFCIGGAVALIQCRDPRNQRSSDHAGFRYRSPDWTDLGRVHHPERVDPSLSPPRHPEQLLAAAGAVAAELTAEFLRVDLFEDDEGPVFSEITPQPGGLLWFGEELDEELGRRWDDAVARSWGQARPASDKPGGSQE